MDSGILEVLLVNARGIKHTNLIRKSAYYVILECGAQLHKSKVSPAGTHEKAYWNEKFIFEYPLPEWNKLTHIKLKIMDKELFTNGGFVGETIIHLGGIITEGNDKGLLVLSPTPYNVVLRDDSYKGQIKIGFKFFLKYQRQVEEESRECGTEKNVNEARNSLCRSILNLFKDTFCSVFLFYKKTQRRPCNSKSN